MPKANQRPEILLNLTTSGEQIGKLRSVANASCSLVGRLDELWRSVMDPPPTAANAQPNDTAYEPGHGTTRSAETLRIPPDLQRLATDYVGVAAQPSSPPSRTASVKRMHDAGDIEMQENMPQSASVDIPNRTTILESASEEDQMVLQTEGLTPPSPGARMLATPASEDLPEDLGLGGAVLGDNTPPNGHERAGRTDDVESEDRHVAFIVPPSTRR